MRYLLLILLLTTCTNTEPLHTVHFQGEGREEIHVTYRTDADSAFFTIKCATTDRVEYHRMPSQYGVVETTAVIRCPERVITIATAAGDTAIRELNVKLIRGLK